MLVDILNEVRAHLAQHAKDGEAVLAALVAVVERCAEIEPLARQRDELKREVEMLVGQREIAERAVMSLSRQKSELENDIVALKKKHAL